MRTLRSILLAAAVASASGCLAHVHTIGDGPRGGEVRTHRTWYALWGIISVDGFDSRHVVGPADHYRVTTRVGGWDFFINLFTVPFTFCCQTTIVEK